jgi:thiol-disulfide isomerase/thioredoxin
MTNTYNEEYFTTTLWHYFPGIIKTLSIIAIVISIFTLFNSLIDSGTNAASNYTFDPKLIRDYNYTAGNKDSKVKYVYFVDFQCPACKSNNENFKQIKEEYKDRVQFVYKHNPLTQIHTNAKQAAIAVQAAGEQGKFIEYGEQAFANQSSLGPDSLEKYAQNVGLDIAKWKSDNSSKKIANYVNFDQEDLKNIYFDKSSVSGTTKPVGEGAGTPTNVLMKDSKVTDWWTGGQEVATIKGKLDELLK